MRCDSFNDRSVELCWWRQLVWIFPVRNWIVRFRRRSDMLFARATVPRLHWKFESDLFGGQSFLRYFVLHGVCQLLHAYRRLHDYGSF